MSRSLWECPACTAPCEYKDTTCPACGEAIEPVPSDVEPYEMFDEPPPKGAPLHKGRKEDE